MNVLFVGNSFTFGSRSAVRTYRGETVADLNGEGVGGVPALIKLFADQAKLPMSVAHETSSGKTLTWHFKERRRTLGRAWDAVVLQEYSTLDPEKPGDPSATRQALSDLTALFRDRNPKVRLLLTATWSRPDLTFRPGKRWSGRPITQMAIDLRRSLDGLVKGNAAIERINPVGEAFNCAIAIGIADGNPYDGIGAGQWDLWAADHYHASAAGYYLEALTVFGGLTGLDPRTLGKGEQAARDLGLTPELAETLQSIAYHSAFEGRCPV